MLAWNSLISLAPRRCMSHSSLEVMPATRSATRFSLAFPKARRSRASTLTGRHGQEAVLVTLLDKALGLNRRESKLGPCTEPWPWRLQLGRCLSSRAAHDTHSSNLLQQGHIRVHDGAHTHTNVLGNPFHNGLENTPPVGLPQAPDRGIQP
jgi:hypothetical protein